MSRKEDESRAFDHESLRDAWIEALLTSLSPQDHEDRIAQLMNHIDSPRELVDASDVEPRSYRGLLWRCTLAALFLFAAVLAYQSFGTKSAVAAVVRSLDVLSQEVPRKYALTIRFSNPGLGNGAIRNEVFVRGRDQFAVKHAGLGGDSWLGHSGQDEYWIVPPVGPVLRCDRSSFYDWINARWGRLNAPPTPRGTPFLHVASALEIMSERCKLTKMPDETIVLRDGRRITCQRIRGEPTAGIVQNPPNTIDLWISRELGIPMKVSARWNSRQDRQPTLSISSLTLVYQGQPDLAANWFTAEAHSGSDSNDHQND
ncbi:MAG: hypothetical protein AAFV88_05165 [Planctomycetota bacterium]